MRQWCSLFIQFGNLPPRDCGEGVQPVYVAWEPTSQVLWVGVQSVYAVSNFSHRDRRAGEQPIYAVLDSTSQGLRRGGAACLWGVGTCLLRTVGQGCSLFMWCRNLTPEDCGAKVQPVYVVWEPFSWRLWGRTATRLWSVRSYLPRTLGQVCSLFMWCHNLPPRDCGAGVLIVYVVSEPTSQGL